MYQGSYSSEVDEVEYLKRTFDIWRGLVEFPTEGESGFQDPSQGFILGLHDFRRVSSISITYILLDDIILNLSSYPFQIKLFDLQETALDLHND